MQRVLPVFFFVIAMSVSQSLFGDVVYHLSILIDPNLNDNTALVNVFPGNSNVSVMNSQSGRSEVFSVQQRSSLGRKLALSPSAANQLGLSDGSVAEVRLVNLSFSGRLPERELSPAAEYQDIISGPRGAEQPQIQTTDPSRLPTRATRTPRLTTGKTENIRPTAPAPSIVPPISSVSPVGSILSPPASQAAPNPSTPNPSSPGPAYPRTPSPSYTAEPQTPYPEARADGLPPARPLASRTTPQARVPQSGGASVLGNSANDSLLIDTEEERLRIPLPDTSLSVETSRPNARISSDGLTSRTNPVNGNGSSQAPSAAIRSEEKPRVVYPAADPRAGKSSSPIVPQKSDPAPSSLSTQSDASAQNTQSSPSTQSSPTTQRIISSPSTQRISGSPRTPSAPSNPSTQRISGSPRAPNAPSESRTENTLPSRDLGPDAPMKSRVESPVESPRDFSSGALDETDEIVRPSGNPRLLKDGLADGRGRGTSSGRNDRSGGNGNSEIYFPKVGEMKPPPSSGSASGKPSGSNKPSGESPESDDSIAGFDDISPSKPSSIIFEDESNRWRGPKESRGNDWGEKSQGGNNLGSIGYNIQEPKPDSDLKMEATSSGAGPSQVELPKAELPKTEPAAKAGNAKAWDNAKLSDTAKASNQKKQLTRVIGRVKTLNLPHGYYIQLVSFLDVHKTRTVYEQFVNEYKMNVVPARVNGKKYYRCLIGSLEESEVAKILRKVRSAGYSDAFVYKNF